MIGAVVLAAGASTRFGAPKQRLLLGDVLTRLAASSVEAIVVVEGAHALAEGAGAPGAPGVSVVNCPDWTLGPGASLRCGLAALPSSARAAVVVLADGPDLAPAAVSRVIESWLAEGGDVVAASYAGSRGHPLLISRAVWDDVPDEGLRLRDPRLVACDDLGPPGDVDRPEDLPERFRQGH